MRAGSAAHDAEWRDPAQIASQWEDAVRTAPGLLRSSVRGSFWDLLDEAGICLLVTREYEHLVVALCVVEGKPLTTFMRLPHPSGIAVDHERGRVHLASTRNPNQVYELAPVAGSLPRTDAEAPAAEGRPLVPVGSRFHPGCLYLHDLALVGGELHGNAVGENAVVRLVGGQAERVWWPRSIETPAGPDFGRNYLQLNSIAAGPDLKSSFFTVSATVRSARRPGHRNFPVDRRGALLAGETREPVALGLTRPHSARFHEGRVWLDNSGYGEVGRVDGDAFEPLARLESWTRGLAFHGKVAFVGVSRVLPRFRSYAPGLDLERSRCGVYALDTATGRTLGSLTWPAGNQVFSVECISRAVTTGFPFAAGVRQSRRLRLLFYNYRVDE